MKVVRNMLFVVCLSLQVFLLCGDESYNCHGFAWQDRPTWLETPPLTLEVDSGPIIVYFLDEQPIHSGKYLGCGLVLSKWGSNSVMLHPVWLSPYGRDWKYYNKKEIKL